MSPHKIRVTARQVDELMACLRDVPSEPGDGHVEEDVMIRCAMGTLAPAEQAQLDTHLAVCPTCAREVAQTCENARAWQGEQGEQRLTRLRERVEIATAAAAAVPWLVLTVVTFAAARLARTRRPKERFGTEQEQHLLFQRWRGEDGLTCILHEQVEEGFLFSVDTREASHNGKLVRFELKEAWRDKAAIDGLLVLHADPDNPGHYGGSARLGEDAILPEDCQPYLSEVELHDRPDRDPLLAAVAAAVAAAAKEEDRRAWRVWAQAEADKGHLLPDLAAAIEAVCEPNTRPPRPGFCSAPLKGGGLSGVPLALLLMPHLYGRPDPCRRGRHRPPFVKERTGPSGRRCTTRAPQTA